MEEVSLYIPMGVKTESELFNGFGKRELIQSLIGSLFCGGIAILLWILFETIPLTIVFLLSGVFGSVMMCTKDQNNQSVVDQVGNIIRFHNSQQIYPYRMLKEWDI